MPVDRPHWRIHQVSTDCYSNCSTTVVVSAISCLVASSLLRSHLALTWPSGLLESFPSRSSLACLHCIAGRPAETAHTHNTQVGLLLQHGHRYFKCEGRGVGQRWRLVRQRKVGRGARPDEPPGLSRNCVHDDQPGTTQQSRRPCDCFRFLLLRGTALRVLCCVACMFCKISNGTGTFEMLVMVALAFGIGGGRGWKAQPTVKLGRARSWRSRPVPEYCRTQSQSVSCVSWGVRLLGVPREGDTRDTPRRA